MSDTTSTTETLPDDVVRITIDVKVTDEDVDSLIDAAGYGMNYWCQHAHIDTDAKTYTIHPHDSVIDGEQVKKEHVVTFADIRKSIGTLYGEDRLPTWFEQELLSGDMAGDSEVGDMIVQHAAFGEIVFG